MEKMKAHILPYFAKAEEEMISIIEKEVLQPVHGDGPGKPEWRKDAAKKVSAIAEEFTDSYLKADIGFDLDGALYE